MPQRITVPQVSANVDDVTVTAWFKQVGDTVTTQDPVAEVTTDKAAFEINSPTEGVLLSQLAPVRSVVPVNYCLGLVGAPSESDSTAESDNTKLMAEYRKRAITPDEPARVTTPRTRTPRVRATPRARVLAKKHNVDLAKVQAETKAPTITEAILAPYLT